MKRVFFYSDKEKGQQRGRGLALFFFLVMLLLFIIPYREFLPEKEQYSPAATLTFNNSGQIMLRPYTTKCYIPPQENSAKLALFLFKKIDINTASFAELTTVRGVGKKMAEEICSLREKREICSREDLLLLKRVGEKKADYLQKKFSLCEKSK